MFGAVSDEMVVDVSANDTWKFYSTLELAKAVEEDLNHLIDKIDVLEGDGGVGTILKITFPPGTPVLSSYKEKFTMVDHEKRMKETEVIEGGYLDLGFTLYRFRFEIIENGENSCITKSTIEYEIKEEAAATNVSFVNIQLLMTIMKTAANYLTRNKNV